MRCVNDTLPPRPRARCALMSVRLSIRSLAGTARTLVAVGTWRLASMLTTTRAEGPRSFSTVAPGAAAGAGAAGLAAAGAFAAAGAGAAVGFAGAAGAGLGGAAFGASTAAGTTDVISGAALSPGE